MSTVAPARLDLARIRADFPILQQRVNGHPLVYLDNAATTQKPRAVIDALVAYYETTNANIHRGIHTLAQRATAQYEASRVKVAGHIGAPRPEDIVFTRNTTEGLNLVARAWGDANVREGDEIVLTEMEHHSNIVPWQLLAQRTGAHLRYARITGDGYLDLDHLRSLMGPRTRLISVMHASNVLGVINPVAEIAEMARAHGALLVVDGAQSAPHVPVAVNSLGADFFAFSAHKMYGPTGTGVLWAREGLLESMDPFLGGGEMISVVRPEHSTWADVPYKFEAGTPNIADVIAFAPAVDYLANLGMDAIREHEVELTAYTIDALRGIPGLRIHGPLNPEHRVGAISFSLGDIHPHDVSEVLDARGVAIRAGHHCAQLLMRHLGVPATNRASLALYSTREEVDSLVAALHDAREVYSR